MSGNVWEWCCTKCRDNYLKDADDSPEGMDDRVLRGGAYGDDPQDVRCAYRYSGFPNYRSSDVGFRVVFLPYR
jgi:formylglycine-generating enzyme required for sulfatase activity